MTCKSCGSDRIFNVGGKCSDMFYASCKGRDYDGYVMRGLGIGGGDMINLSYCGNCGKIVGSFPLPVTQLEEENEDELE